MILLVLLCLAGSAMAQKKVAVYASDMDNASQKMKTYGLILTRQLGVKVSQSSQYAAAVRTDEILAVVNKEHAYERGGSVDNNSIAEAGKQLGVDYVLVVTLIDMGDEVSLYVDWQLVNVVTAIADDADGTTYEIHNMAADLQKLADQLAERITGGSAKVKSFVGSTTSGSDFTENTFGINMKMKYVQGGSFMMGCTSEQGGDCESDEKTLRRVTVSDYYIGVFEVTQGQWEKVMGTSVTQQRNKKNPSLSLVGTGSDYPMYYVSWEEAMAFCRELSRQTGKTYTLPTEAQWEYAARGGNQPDGSKYSGSYSVDAVAWYDGNSGSSTHPVGTKRPNALGLYDMSGNVYEWCLDWYGDYSDYDTENPTGASSGSYRVLRGGCWGSRAQGCRVSYRGNGSPDGRGNIFGFRVVLVP